MIGTTLTATSRRASIAIAGCATLMMAASAGAANLYMDNVRIEGRLVKALVEINFLDFAESQVALMKEAFPQEKDLVTIYEAEYLVGKGQRNNAAALLEAVKPDSPYFADVALKRGDLATEPADKVKAYAAYFNVFGDPPKDADGIHIWSDAIFKYYMALIGSGDAKKASQVLDLTKKLPEEMQYNPRMLVYLKSQAVLKLADLLLDDKKPIDGIKAQIQQAKKDLEGLMWGGADSVAALGYGELAHANVLLGEEDKAIKIIQDANSLLGQVEEVFKKETGSIAMSPVAGALFYRGEAYYSKARKLKDKGKKEDIIANLKLAVNDFYTVATRYRDNPISSRANDRVNTIRTILKEKYDLEIKLDDTQEQIVLLEAAKKAYKDEEWDKAAELFLRASSANLKGEEVPSSLKFATVCLYRKSRYLEAIAVADFLYDWYRRSPDAHSALYNLGVTLYKASKTEKNPAMQEELSDYANMMFGRFVRAAPSDPKAPGVAMRCADYEYNRALRQRDEKNKIKDDPKSTVKDVNRAIEKMRGTFLEAIPLYEILTEHYGSTPEAVLAYNKLGWIYLINEEPIKSAESFLQFVSLTEQPTEEKAQAKYFAAERYMTAAMYDQAIAHFEEFLEWTDPKGSYPKDSKDIRKYRGSAEGMILWCYELKRQGLNTEIESMIKAIAKLEAEIAAPAEPKPEVKPEVTPEVKPTDPAAPADPDGSSPEQGTQTPAQQLAELKERFEKMKADSESLRQKALTGFVAFVEAHPKDPQTPQDLMKIGVMYMEVDNETEAVRWLEKLKNEYPDSDAAKQAAFTLGKALVDAGRWDKASSAFKDATSKMPEMALGNLSYIAGKLYRDDLRTEKGLAPDVVLAANREIEKRGNNPQHADFARIEPQKERLLFRIAECLQALGQNEEALTTYDRVVSEAKAKGLDNTRYYYEVLFGKGRSYVALGDSEKALLQFDEALTYIPTDTEPVMYAEAVLASAEALMLKKDFTSTAKAASRCKQLIYAFKPEDEKVSGYLETAYLKAAEALSLIGLTADAEKLQAQYKEAFPRGQFRQKIMVLPAQEFRK